MTRFLILLLSLIPLMGAQAHSLLPRQYEGTMMPYDFSLEEPPSWGDTLQPVYCAYVARHGARYMTAPKKFDKLEPVLRQAKSEDNLTPAGADLLAAMDSILALSHGKWGQLSEVGVREQEILGNEMTRLFPATGTWDAEVNTLSSFVPRAMMTMYQFNHAMMLVNDKLNVTTGSGHRYSPLVYFFDTDSVYDAYRRDGDWKKLTAKYQAENIPTEPLARVFKRPVKLKEHKAQDLVMDIYAILQSRRAMGLSGPDDSILTAEEYRQCWLLSNLTHYLRNCVTPLNGNMVPVAVTTLVRSIIEGADSALNRPDGQKRLDGYFGHAETLMPLLSALRIPGCHAMTTDAEALATQWKSENVVPLGANLALFLFQTESGTMAAVRLNGRNVKPVPGRGYLVPWKDLSNYWLSLIH